jgi:hypothetical protein
MMNTGPIRAEGTADPGGDGIPSYLDDDSDGDGTPDVEEDNNLIIDSKPAILLLDESR